MLLEVSFILDSIILLLIIVLFRHLGSFWYFFLQISILLSIISNIVAGGVHKMKVWTRLTGSHLCWAGWVEWLYRVGWWGEEMQGQFGGNLKNLMIRWEEILLQIGHRNLSGFISKLQKNCELSIKIIIVRNSILYCPKLKKLC